MKKYIVYGLSSCSYCVRVVNKLIEEKKSFYVELLDNNPERLKLLKIAYEHPTVPIVIVKEEEETLLGGCDDTMEYLSNEVKQ